MRELRRQRGFISWLLVVAVIGSSIAKINCRTPVLPGAVTIATAAYEHCHGQGSDHGTSDKAPAQKRVSGCPVCLALAATLVSSGIEPAIEARQYARFDGLGSYSDDGQSRPLRLGGVGSRAPPLPA